MAPDIFKNPLLLISIMPFLLVGTKLIVCGIAAGAHPVSADHIFFFSGEGKGVKIVFIHYTCQI